MSETPLGMMLRITNAMWSLDFLDPVEQLNLFNPISYGRGGLRGSPLTELTIAPKRIYNRFESSWLFLYIKNQNFEEEKKSDFFTPTPPQMGVLKKGRFWKLVGEPKLQNMICSTIEIRHSKSSEL